MQKIVKNGWALSALMACFAFASYGDSFTWKGGEGSWNEASNWLLGGGISTRVPGVDTTDDSVVLGDVDATIRFPTTVEETKYIGSFYINGVSPAADLSTTRTITLDTRGTSFYYTNTVDGVHPIIKGYTYNRGWKEGPSDTGFYLSRLPNNGNTTMGTLFMSNALHQIVMTPTNTTLIQKEGHMMAAGRAFFLYGATGGNTTNWTEVVIEKGDFDGALRLRGYSRFIFKSDGNLNGISTWSAIHLLPRCDNTGNNYGGGPAEFIMSAGTNREEHGPIEIGGFGGADGRFVLCGTAKMERYGTGTVDGNTWSRFGVANDTLSNSAWQLEKRGEAILADSASLHIVGRNQDNSHFGDLLIGTATNGIGIVTIKDDASATFDNGYAAVGSGGESSGYLTVEGRGTLKVLGTVTGTLPTTSVGINLGGAGSKEAVFTIKDSALVETPRVAAINANSLDWFVGNTLRLEGGTLKTSVIEGSVLDVVVDNGMICARAATTAAAPLLAANGIKSMTATGEKTLTIDTQGYDTYVTYAFPEDLTIVKKGSGTLYVKNSPHAKTIVENGAIEMTEDGGVFGKSWELGEDTELPLPTVTETSEVVLMNFASETDAQAYAAAYEEHVIRKSGYKVGTIKVTQSGDIYQVTVTVEVVTEGATKTWAGAEGAKWNAAASWSPEGIPEPDDTLTVSGAATMELPRFGFANTLNLNQNTLALTGSKSELRIDTVSVKGDKTSKEYNVAEGNAVTITAANFKTEDVGFKKTGAGSLTLDLSATPNLVYISSNATDSIRVNEGELAVIGSGTIVEGSAHIGRSGTCFYDTTLKNTMVGGTETPANGLSSLVLDNAGFGRPDIFASRDGGSGGSILVGNFGADAASATASLALVNGSMICADSVEIGYQPLAQNTTAYLYVTNSTLCAISSKEVGFGYVANDDQANSGLKVVARLGEGAVVRDVGGGNGDGAVRFGCGLDVAFEDGAILKQANEPNFRNDGVDNHAKGWVRSYSRAFGDVSFTSGATMSFAGGFLLNNYATPSLSESRRLRLIFDGGIFKPLLVDATDARAILWECRTAVFYAPEYQGFWAGADGMNVDMSACSRYTIAAPIRGEGELVKTGTGTLVMGKGLKPTTDFKNCDYITEEMLVNEKYFAASEVVTVQNAGGVRIAEGTVELEAGATDTNSTFTVESGCTVDLADNTVALGALKGAGTVSGGTISMLALKPLADGEDAVTLSDVTINKAVIDFGGAADKNTTVRLVKLGSNVSGALSAGSTFRLKAVNTGVAGLNGAICTVDSDGLITAQASPSGLLLIIR